MKVVAIGGGHGAAASLQAALTYASDVAGIITVADDGGSSGRLARELGVLPMGDIRNCLAALAPDSGVVDVFQHRFSDGPLAGHVMGNLFITAAAEETGSFPEAVRLAGELIGSRGRVVPPTIESVKLVSEIDGEVVVGQVALATTRGRISYVSLEPPEPKAFPEALDLIARADQIILGPGSLFTSILPSLLVPEVRQAVSDASATKVFVCNLSAPDGETQYFDAGDHLAALLAHGGQACVDSIVVHEGRRLLWGRPVTVDRRSLEGMGVEVFSGDLLPEHPVARHDPARLGELLSSL